MAVYGYDFYGLSKYGSKVLVDYGVEPFTAEAISYDQVLVTWNEPSGNWTNFRLLRNTSGYSVNEDDGTILYTITASPTGNTWTDDVPGSGWYYYTIFIYNPTNAEWERSALASALVPVDYKSQQELWDNLPEYFRVVKDNSAGYSSINYTINPALYLEYGDTAANLQLWGFLGVFGWGLDILRTQIDTTLWGVNTDKMHLNRLALLSDEFGSSLEQAVPAQTARNLVRNLGLLYRKRGTLDGIEELLSLATGWDVDVVLGPNVMLSEDQSNFVTPKVEDWNSTVRYVTGETVRFNSRFFTANVTAYGSAQSPPSTGNNTWWNQIVTIQENVSNTRADTANISTWQAISLSPTTPLTAATSTHVGRGVTHPTDGAILNTNALGIKNTQGSTKDIIVQSVPYLAADTTQLDRKLTIQSIIPVPQAPATYVAGTTYHRGDFIRYQGVAYEALHTTTSVPTTAADWRPLGYDERIRMCMSFYAHGPFTGTGGTGGLSVIPYLLLFDDTGVLQSSIVLDSTQRTQINYDSFNKTGNLVAARPLDLGGKTWATVVGTWAQGWYDTGYVYPSSGARVYATVGTTQPNCAVAVTFRNVGTRLQGIMFRHTDTSNYWRAGQSALVKVVAGTPTTMASYATFVAGDRMTVLMSGSAITVYKNGVAVTSGVSDAFNSTSGQHGIVVE